MKNYDDIFESEYRSFQIRQVTQASIIFCAIFAAGFVIGVLLGALVV